MFVRDRRCWSGSDPAGGTPPVDRSDATPDNSGNERLDRLEQQQRETVEALRGQNEALGQISTSLGAITERLTAQPPPPAPTPPPAPPSGDPPAPPGLQPAPIPETPPAPTERRRKYV